MNKTGGVNKVMLVGRIYTELETNTISNGTQLSFVLLTEEETSSLRGVVPHNEYHNIIIPGNLKSIDRVYLVPDIKLFIQGRIQTTCFTDAENIRRYKVEIVATQVELLK